MVRRVVRTERHREEALLPAARYEVAHVEERVGDLAVAHDADRADLLDDVEGRRISRRRRHVRRRIEAADEGSERVRGRHLLRLEGRVRVPPKKQKRQQGGDYTADRERD